MLYEERARRGKRCTPMTGKIWKEIGVAGGSASPSRPPVAHWKLTRWTRETGRDGEHYVQRQAMDGPCTCPTTLDLGNSKQPNTMPQTTSRRAPMATFNRERVAHALNELLARIVPDDPNEDPQQADERFDEAYNGALDELSNAEPLSVVADMNHIAELIDTRRMELIGWATTTFCG